MALQERAPEDTSAGSPASLAKRGCFTSGDNWGANKAYALSFAALVCNTDFRGTYNPGNIRAKCYNLDSTKKVDFSLQLTSNNGQRSIEAAECYDGLQKEINGCDQGGSTGYANWRYTSDPNAGQCAPGT
ncbi:hypothetical protein GQ53DRAFT_823731 [Thozetella sp. PMI_491]|nr:hypothetical protein GQ53DRAFT_823731 [Thozetella sp. PMI_491]